MPGFKRWSTFFDVLFTQQSDMTAKELDRCCTINYELFSVGQTEKRWDGRREKRTCIRICCIWAWQSRTLCLGTRAGLNCAEICVRMTSYVAFNIRTRSLIKDNWLGTPGQMMPVLLRQYSQKTMSQPDIKMPSLGVCLLIITLYIHMILYYIQNRGYPWEPENENREPKRSGIDSALVLLQLGMASS